ncbi:MAG: type III-B CRISPR module RAMP protein Cmr4 [Planctomyces sp.]|nr:type III-B CRISPR module RAMP protein Cmr4 [Planctomyces sp.]
MSEEKVEKKPHTGSSLGTLPSGSTSALIVIHVIESMHCGTGESRDGIDAVIAREAHTRWPIIPRSQMKGGFRSACCDAQYHEDYSAAAKEDKQNLKRSSINSTNEKLTAVFGPREIAEAEDAHSGAVRISPARILAFPICSHRGVFAWITCPEVLLQLKRNLIARRMSSLLQFGTETANCLPNTFPNLDFAAGEALFADDAAVAFLRETSKCVRLAELTFKQKSNTECDRALSQVTEWFNKFALNTDACTNKDFKQRLVMVSNEAFSHLVRYKTEVVQRNSLDYDTKTVAKGLLFSMELLPPETLLYATVRSEATRGTHVMAAQDVHKYVKEQLGKTHNVLQFGADQSKDAGVSILKWNNTPAALVRGGRGSR